MAIDTTDIDITKPNQGNALTQDVRDNFSAIKDHLDVIGTGYDDKAEAITNTPVNGVVRFIGGTDGGWFKEITGASAATYSDNGGAYCGTRFIPTGGDGSAAWVRDDEGLPYLISWWGAAGTATATENSARIQSCLDYAASVGGSVSDIADVSYAITTIKIKNGINRVDFTNGTLIPNNSTNPDNLYEAAVVITGVNSGEAAPVSGARLSFNIDMSAGDRTAIVGDNTTDCTIDYCDIYGFTNHATYNHRGIRLSDGASGNTIENNRITGYDTPTQRGLLIEIWGAGAAFGGFFTGTVTRGTTVPKDNIVKSNHLIDGSYALNMHYCEDSVFSHNVCRNQNHRAMYFANSCWNNVIAENNCTFFFSSGIILAYGASHNLVANNKFTSDAAHCLANEAVINVNTGASNNTILGNTTDAPVNYGVYIATDSSNCIVDGNDIRNQYLAGIAVENDWIDALPTGALYSRPNYGDPTILDPPNSTSWTYNDLTGTVIQNNTIHHGYAGRNTSAIYLAQINNTLAGSTQTALINTTIKNNTVISMDQIAYCLYVFEDTAGELNSIRVSGNTWNDAATILDFIAYNTTFHNALSYLQRDEEILGDLVHGLGVDFVNGDTTPDVSTWNYFAFANTGATSVTDFDGAQDGKEITIRLDANTTIVYTSGLIRPKGLVNITTFSTNAFVAFKQLTGVWIEQWRSF